MHEAMSSLFLDLDGDKPSFTPARYCGDGLHNIHSYAVKHVCDLLLGANFLYLLCFPKMFWVLYFWKFRLKVLYLEIELREVLYKRVLYRKTCVFIYSFIYLYGSSFRFQFPYSGQSQSVSQSLSKSVN